jgi:hypothetical protein
MQSPSASDGPLDPPASEPGLGAPAGTLSLDGKLAAIAQDRAVLHLLRDLADCGLREGDRVCHRSTGVQGRLAIDRIAVAPRILVRPDQPGALPLPAGDLTHWLRR